MNEVIEVASEGLESSTPATDVEKTEPTSFYDNFEGDDRGYLETKGWDSPQKVLLQEI